MKSTLAKKQAMKECPYCKQMTYIVSIFGSICSRCLKGDKEEKK